MGGRDRIEILDGLRGLAALAVTWFHFTNGSQLFDGAFKASGAYGWLGVHAFFVISGFVIPYSMLRGGYRGLSDAGAFMLKRLMRLEPPYLISILLVLGLLYASAAAPGFHGPPPNVTAARVLLHLGYLNVFFARDWLNPVYWTLAVEFQFYLSMILLFPLLGHRDLRLRVVGLSIMAGLALAVRDHDLLFSYLGLFALGALAFQVRAGLLTAKGFAPGAAVLGGVCWATLGPAEAVVGVAVAAAAAFANPPRVPLLGFLGAISYSLYLLHVPIGGRVMNLAGRLPSMWHAPASLVALALSLAAAYVFYRLVERPSQRLSGRLRYAATRQAPGGTSARSSALPSA